MSPFASLRSLAATTSKNLLHHRILHPAHATKPRAPLSKAYRLKVPTTVTHLEAANPGLPSMYPPKVLTTVTTPETANPGLPGFCPLKVPTTVAPPEKAKAGLPGMCRSSACQAPLLKFGCTITPSLLALLTTPSVRKNFPKVSLVGLLSQWPTHTCTLQRLESRGNGGMITTEKLYLIFPMTLEQVKDTDITQEDVPGWKGGVGGRRLS